MFDLIVILKFCHFAILFLATKILLVFTFFNGWISERTLQQVTPIVMFLQINCSSACDFFLAPFILFKFLSVQFLKSFKFCMIKIYQISCTDLMTKIVVIRPNTNQFVSWQQLGRLYFSNYCLNQAISTYVVNSSTLFLI